MALHRLILPCLALSTAAACGGATTTSSGPTYGTETTLPAGPGAGSGFLSASEVENLAVAAEALRTATFDDNRFTPTTSSGIVNMTGFIGMQEDGNDTESIIGNMSLAVDFDMEDITGSVSDLAVYQDDNGTYTRVVDFTGTLNLNGIAVGSGLSADLIGNISDGVDTYAIDVDLGGDLYDVDGTNTYQGTADGLYTLNGSTTNLSGEFVAQ